MTEDRKIVSKVLVHECDEDALNALKDICTEHSLVGLKVSTGNNSIGLKDATNEIDHVLKSNVDLGAIFLSEEPDHNGVSGLDLCSEIHRERPALPIFIRRKSTNDASDFPADIQSMIAGCYHLDDLDHLKALINEYLCSMFYPIELAMGIEKISEDSIGSIANGMNVKVDLPYLVKDQIIYGELYSLIPLESDWCRGYMMMQTTENEILALIRSGKTHINTEHPDFRDANAILNELTNMIWGGIKSRYFSSENTQDLGLKTQVPIIVNHLQRHISFGSTEPQLCFKFTLTDPERRYPEIVIYQRMVFNLAWSPENFKEGDQEVEDFVDNGELEFF